LAIGRGGGPVVLRGVGSASASSSLDEEEEEDEEQTIRLRFFALVAGRLACWVISAIVFAWGKTVGQADVLVGIGELVRRQVKLGITGWHSKSQN
jgi:hypothetical protein